MIRNKKNGFTLIELLVTATIIALLTMIGVVSFTTTNQRARNGKRKADMEQARSALELYRTAIGTYPATTWSTMMGALYPTYISTSTLADPKADATHSYTYVTPSPAGGSAGKTYRVCATLLEVTSAPYCLDNP